MTPTKRWRVYGALLILALYVGVAAINGFAFDASAGAMLPSTVGGVLRAVAGEFVLFGGLFVLVVLLSNLRAGNLWLTWRGWWVVPRALGWSIVLRIGVGLILGAGIVAWQAIQHRPLDSIKDFRPKVEALINIDALHDPLYFALMLTVVSFVLAGLREELWRAGMIALMAKAFPSVFGGERGPWLALFPVALLFGLAHMPEGWFGVGATTLLGLGLGAVMLLHRSVWDAVLAHGFFNAATFAILPWLAQQMPELRR